jgi:hypothetical protein
MARVFTKPTAGSPPLAAGPSTYNRVTPTNVRDTILTHPISHRPTNPTRHPPRDFWQQPDVCPHCKTHGPRGDICMKCTNPRYYYGNEVSGEDTLPLLARLMASAIVKENDNNMAQFYAESLIDYYVAEYYTAGKIADPNATEDPNDYNPSSI